MEAPGRDLLTTKYINIKDSSVASLHAAFETVNGWQKEWKDGNRSKTTGPVSAQLFINTIYFSSSILLYR